MGGLYPTRTRLRPVDPVLSRICSALANDPQDFLYEKVLPVIADGSSANASPEGQETWISGTIQRLRPSSFFGDPTARMTIAPGEEIPISKGADYAPMTFECRKYARQARVLWENRQANNLAMMAEEQKQLLQTVLEIKLQQEIDLRNLLFAAGNWANTLTGVALAPGVNQFLCFNVAGSDPTPVFIEASNRVDIFGRRANTCVIGRAGYDAIRQNAAFNNFDDVTKDRTLLTESRFKDVLASRFDLTNVHVGNVVFNTNPDPRAAPTMQRVYGDDMWIGYLPTGGNLSTPLAVSAPSPQGLGINQMTPMAAGRVISHKWTVTPHEDHDHDADLYKVRSMEWIGVIQRELGCFVTNLVN